MATPAIGELTTVVRRRSFSETYIGEWITTTDHKKIGLMYIFTGLLFFLVGGMGGSSRSGPSLAPTERQGT